MFSAINQAAMSFSNLQREDRTSLILHGGTDQKARFLGSLLTITELVHQTPSHKKGRWWTKHQNAPLLRSQLQLSYETCQFAIYLISQIRYPPLSLSHSLAQHSSYGYSFYSCGLSLSEPLPPPLFLSRFKDSTTLSRVLSLAISQSLPSKHEQEYDFALANQVIGAISSIVENAHLGLESLNATRNDYVEGAEEKKYQLALEGEATDIRQCGFLKSRSLVYWCEMTFGGLLRFFRKSSSGRWVEAHQIHLSDVALVLEYRGWVATFCSSHTNCLRTKRRKRPLSTMLPSFS